MSAILKSLIAVVASTPSSTTVESTLDHGRVSLGSAYCWVDSGRIKFGSAFRLLPSAA